MLTSNIQQIGKFLLNDKQFLHELRVAVQQESMEIKRQSKDLSLLIEEIKGLLCQLIQQQLENQLKQIIEDNNRILKQVQLNVIKANEGHKLHELASDVSFTEVHRLMSDERKKIVMSQEINDASLERSISAFVQLKVETIEERVINIDQRLKSMQDKYQTNLKSIWNVLSITQSALFDHLKQCKSTEKNKRQSTVFQQNSQQKKSFFGMFKLGK